MGRKPAVDYRGLFERFRATGEDAYTVHGIAEKNKASVVRYGRAWASRNGFPDIEIKLLRGTRTVVLKKKV